MFSGIIEAKGQIIGIEKLESNVSLWIKSYFISEVSLDQSIAHNGICLTVDKIEGERYRITAIKETIDKTTLSEWKKQEYVNLERCLKLSDRLDGHIVQGHVDTVGECVGKQSEQGSYTFTFLYPNLYKELVIEKGSICVDGISLTCHSLRENFFSVSIIPFTYEHTIASQWTVGKKVNLEFDIIGKYIQRKLSIS